MATQTGGGLTGLAVVTLAGGERLGRVHDMVFLAATGRITGFLVEVGGLFAKPKFLSAGQVKSVGTDALTVNTADALGEHDPTASDPDELAARSLEGRMVMNASGNVLGKVADVIVDTDSLSIPALTISTGLLNNALHGKPRLPLELVKTIGKDSLVVPDTYDPGAVEHHDR